MIRRILRTIGIAAVLVLAMIGAATLIFAPELLFPPIPPTLVEPALRPGMSKEQVSAALEGYRAYPANEDWVRIAGWHKEYRETVGKRPADVIYYESPVNEAGWWFERFVAFDPQTGLVVYASP